MSSDHTIRVPGGSLYYRTQGHGPPLMLIGGGPSNADTLSALATDLAGAPDGDPDHGYTVVTYDRRGYSRSHLDDREQHRCPDRAGTGRGRARGGRLAGGPRTAAPGGGAGDKVRAGDIELFVQRDIPAVGRYHLDLKRLAPLAGRIVVAGGRDSRDFYPYHCAERLAEELGVPLAELPGHHAGMIQYPAEFAARLRELLPSVR